MSWWTGFGGGGSGAPGPPGPSGGGDVQSEVQVLANGQTVFNLLLAAKSAEAIWVIFNRATLIRGVDYTVSGGTFQTITFSGTAPPVLTTDSIIIYYQKA